MIIIITTTTIKLNRILIQLLATNYLTKEMYPLCPYLNDLLLLLCMLQLKALFYVVMSREKRPSITLDDYIWVDGEVGSFYSQYLDKVKAFFTLSIM